MCHTYIKLYLKLMRSKIARNCLRLMKFRFVNSIKKIIIYIIKMFYNKNKCLTQKKIEYTYN